MLPLRSGGIGGSSQTIVYRNKRQKCDRAANASSCVESKVGAEEITELLETWKSLDAREHAEGDGIILALIKLGVSQIEIRSMLGVGGYRVCRLQKAFQNGMVSNEHATRRVRPTPKHAVTSAEIDAIKEHAQTFELEDGFPCSH